MTDADANNPVNITVTGPTDFLWALLQSLEVGDDVTVEGVSTAKTHASASGAVESMVLAIASAGGVHAFSRIVIELLRRKNVAIKITREKDSVEIDGSHENVEKLLATILERGKS